MANYVFRRVVDSTNPYSPCASVAEGCCPAECSSVSRKDGYPKCDLTSCPSTATKPQTNGNTDVESNDDDDKPTYNMDTVDDITDDDTNNEEKPGSCGDSS